MVRSTLAVIALVSAGYLAYELVRVAALLRISSDLANSATAFQRLSGEPHLLVVGDSTGVGVGSDNADRSVAGRFGTQFQNWSIENRAVSGARISSLAEQLRGAARQRYDVILIQVAGNDIVRLRSADTLRIFGQTTSFPGALSTVDAQALGAIGTSTVDLDAGAIGIAARIGTRYTFTQPVGHNGVSLMLRGGVEYDLKPSGAEVVSWRGTTVRAGAGISRATSTTTAGASVEVTRSFSDSLGGRNLFPGGGALTLDGRLLRFVGADGTGFVSANAFYSRPLNIERPDQPTRLIPIGDFAAVTLAGAFPVRELTLLPTVSLMRESSSATALVNGTVVNGVVLNRVTTQLNASGFTSSVSLGLAIPLGRFVMVTPEVGGAFGTVSQTVSSSFPRRIGRPIVRSQGFSDPIRGGWFALEISISQ